MGFERNRANPFFGKGGEVHFCSQASGDELDVAILRVRYRTIKQSVCFLFALFDTGDSLLAVINPLRTLAYPDKQVKMLWGFSSPTSMMAKQKGFSVKDRVR